VRQPQGSHYWTKPLGSDTDLYVARTSPGVNRQTGSRLDPAVAIKNPSKTAIKRLCACERFLACGEPTVRRESHLSLPLEVGVGVYLVRHQGRETSCAELLFEHLPDRGILGAVLDLIVGGDDLFGVSVQLNRRVDR
jgi:hypothetical protein